MIAAHHHVVDGARLQTDQQLEADVVINLPKLKTHSDAARARQIRFQAASASLRLTRQRSSKSVSSLHRLRPRLTQH